MADSLWTRALRDQLGALDLVKLLLRQESPEIRDLQSSWRVDERLLRSARPYAWSAESVDAVLAASKSIPLDTALGKWNLPSETAWWHFEKSLPFRTISVHEDLGIRALCFGWIPTRTMDFGMPCCTWVDSDEPRYSMKPSQTWEWGKGETLEDMLKKSRAHHEARYGPGGAFEGKPKVGIEVFMAATEGLSRFLLAGTAWLEQRVLEHAERAVERHLRKELERRSPGATTTVRVVQLRRTEPRSGEEGARREVDWSHRWVVDGHWRNQAVGKNHSERKLIYIMPFVKGPEDKPLVVKQTVFEVKR